jgi:murein DD-endopeptidase MepM/ murein hydrolase activator NlpD
VSRERMRSRMAWTGATLALVFVAVDFVGLGQCAQAQAFEYNPSGTLVPGSGQGLVSETLYAPNLRFPIEASPAFANSQVYGRGGNLGPGGGLCDAENFSYPWWDNFCETRGRSGNTTPLCPNQNGTHHAGQDIRAASCSKTEHWGVAGMDGTITNVGSYSVDLTTADGLRFQYLHMDNVQVTEGQVVTAGTRLGNISNRFFDSAGNSVPTSVHLHFGIKANVAGVGVTWVPPYASLVAAYKRLLGNVDWGATVVNMKSKTLDLSPGIETEVLLTLVNTGKATWIPGETFLGTTGPRDRESPFRTGEWQSPTRVMSVPKEIAPNEPVTLLVPIKAVADVGTYTESFGLVQEFVAWFGDSGGPADDAMTVTINVTPPVPFRAAYEGHTFAEDNGSISLRAAESREGAIEVRNTGTETWTRGTTELRTTGPRDRESTFAASDWPAPSRAALLDEDTAPGEIGRFTFKVRAPFALGEHAETFGLWHSTGGWFGDSGGPSDDTIRLVVVTTEQAPGVGAGLEQGCSITHGPARRGGWVPVALVGFAFLGRRRRTRRRTRAGTVLSGALLALALASGCGKKAESTTSAPPKPAAVTLPAAPLALANAHGALEKNPSDEAARKAYELVLFGHRRAVLDALAKAHGGPSAGTPPTAEFRWLRNASSDMTRAAILLAKGRVREARNTLALTYSRKTPAGIAHEHDVWVRQDLLAQMAAIESRAGFAESAVRAAEKGLGLSDAATAPRLALLTEQATALAALGRGTQASEFWALAAKLRTELAPATKAPGPRANR